MEEINYILLVSRWLHIVAAAVAIGAFVFMRIALLPSVKQTLDDETRGKLHEAVRARWGRVVHLCVASLLVTGVINFMILAMPMESPPAAYHAIFGVKVLIAMMLFFVASALASRGAGLAKFRQRPATWLTVGVVCGLLIVLLSGALGQIRVGESTAQTPEITSDEG